MLKLSEKVFVVTMLFYMTGAIVPFIGGEGVATQASSAELAVELPLYGLAFIFVVMHWKGFLEAALSVKWILALTLLAVASSAWSQVPLFTLRRSVILVATTAFGIYFGSRFDIDEQLRLLAYAFVIVIVTSFIFAIFLPQYGIDDSLHNGAWQGVFAHKNSLGRVIALATIVFLFLQNRRTRWIKWIGVAVCLALLVLSRSATSVVVLAVVIGTLPLFSLLRKQYSFVVPLLAMGGLILVLGIQPEKIVADQVLQLLHRNPGLTGRIRLWTAVLLAISKRPWLGYGFEGFWLGMSGASQAIVERLHWIPPHSHNGYLDITLEIGIVGFCVFAIGYVGLWRRAIRFLRADSGPAPVWLCAYLFFLLIYNFSERTILDQNSIFWVLYASTAVSLYLDCPVVAEEDIADNDFIPGSHLPNPVEPQFSLR